jgi:hypothetical protein
MTTEIEIATEATMIAIQWQKVMVNEFSFFSKKEIEELHENFVQNNSYRCVVASAAFYLAYCKYNMNYGESDVYHYPMEKEWDIISVFSACRELVFNAKGLSANSCFTVSPVTVRELYEMFHFTFTDFEDTENGNVIKMHFVHKNTKEKCYAYCACEDKSVLERRPFYFRVMVPGDEKPVLVTVCEKETVVKIGAEDRLQGIAAEYVWANNKFPGCEITKQRHGTKIIDGKSIAVEILDIKLLDDTTKEITFDISDFTTMEQEL